MVVVEIVNYGSYSSYYIVLGYQYSTTVFLGVDHTWRYAVAGTHLASARYYIHLLHYGNGIARYGYYLAQYYGTL